MFCKQELVPILQFSTDLATPPSEFLVATDNAPRKTLAHRRRLALSIIGDDNARGSNRVKIACAGWAKQFLVNLIRQI